jgi:hypothetical protein
MNWGFLVKEHPAFRRAFDWRSLPPELGSVLPLTTLVAFATVLAHVRGSDRAFEAFEGGLICPVLP